MINILIVDDHTLVRDGIKSLLSNIEDITVCGICSTGEEPLVWREPSHLILSSWTLS